MELRGVRGAAVPDRRPAIWPGLDHQMVPQYLIKACREMGLAFNLVDFNYRVIEIETIKHPDPKFGELTFLEGKRDIPFPIRRVYWITQTEAEAHRYLEKEAMDNGLKRIAVAERVIREYE